MIMAIQRERTTPETKHKKEIEKEMTSRRRVFNVENIIL